MNFQFDNSDDPEFASRVSRIVSSVVSATSPPEFYLVKVDNWFGPKWLAFSHKVLGAFGVASRDLVVPPFVPGRIVSEAVFVRGETGGYAATEPARPLHVTQNSAANAARKLSRLLPRTAIFWWSGESATNGRGSLMAYLPTPDGHVPWYVELSGKLSWRPSVTKGVSGAEIQSYLSAATATDAA